MKTICRIKNVIIFIFIPAVLAAMLTHASCASAAVSREDTAYLQAHVRESTGESVCFSGNYALMLQKSGDKCPCSLFPDAFAAPLHTAEDINAGTATAAFPYDATTEGKSKKTAPQTSAPDTVSDPEAGENNSGQGIVTTLVTALICSLICGTVAGTAALIRFKRASKREAENYSQDETSSKKR